MIYLGIPTEITLEIPVGSLPGIPTGNPPNFSTGIQPGISFLNTIEDALKKIPGIIPRIPPGIPLEML